MIVCPNYTTATLDYLLKYCLFIENLIKIVTCNGLPEIQNSISRKSITIVQMVFFFLFLLPFHLFFHLQKQSKFSGSVFCTNKPLQVQRKSGFLCLHPSALLPAAVVNFLALQEEDDNCCKIWYPLMVLVCRSIFSKHLFEFCSNYAVKRKAVGFFGMRGLADWKPAVVTN